MVHVSTHDVGGGAARGAYWLHLALRQSGVDSRMFVAFSNQPESAVIASAPAAALCRARETIDDLALSAYPRRHPIYFSPASFTASHLADEINALGADIVNLHWVAGGFLLPEEIARLRGRVVWTLRDMWPFTGGCHYSEGCVRYGEQCGACPVLGSTEPDDITRQLWRRKDAAWRGVPLHLVGVSRWMADCARASSLFRGRPATVIPNGLSTGTFRPRDRRAARQALGLSESAKVILFGALFSTTDHRKGFQFLHPALEQLKDLDGLELVVFGASEAGEMVPPGLPTRFLGTIFDDEKLSGIYSAADVTVVPSMEDACPKVPIESMACGTPVVCFDATGMKDIVDHEINGYRATCYQAGDLAAGLRWVLEDSVRRNRLADEALAKVHREFTLPIQARRYRELYESLLASPLTVNDIT